MNDHLENGQNLPLRASGEFLGYSWEFRSDVVGDSAHMSISFIGPDAYIESGGIGPLPFADIGRKTLGHIGSYGWSGGWLRKGVRRIHQPGSVSGVVGRDVAKVLILFKNATLAEALMIESRHPDVQFFFLPYHPKARWTELVALDAQGRKLDRALPWKQP